MNKRYLFITLVLLAMLAVATPVLVAQSLVSGDITGTVTDPSGAVVSGATVNLKSVEYGTSQSATTNASGLYRFSLLKPGHYSVEVIQKGFQKSQKQVQVSVGQATAANFALTMGQATETIEVSGGEVALVNTDNANVSTSYNLRELTNVPNPGGDITNIATLAPGVTMNTSAGYGNFTANGMPGTANLFTINGENNMDPFFNIGNSGATNLMLGMNEVQEATVVTNPYSGQYGQQAGAQVNVITKGGTNQFHGQAKYLWNGRVMNANDWFNNNSGTPRSFANNNQWGADFGGPIKKDKTFFYVNTEGLRYLLPTVQSTIVPTQQYADAVLANIATAQPNSLPLYQKLFNVWMAAPGIANAQPMPGTCGSIVQTEDADGNPISPISHLAGIPADANAACMQKFSATPGALSTEWILSGRLDQNFGQNDKVFFRYKQDKGTQATYTDPINPNFNALSKQPSWDGQMQWTRVFNGTTTNQFIMSGSYYRALFNQDEAKAVDTFPYDWSFSGEAAFTNFARLRSFPQGRNITQYQFIDDFSKIVGNHNLKFGANFRRYDVSDYNFFYVHPRVYVNNLLSFANGKSRMREQFPTTSSVPIAMYGVGMYAQDEWSVNNKLKLTLALRLEHNSNPVCQTDCFSLFKGDFTALAHGTDVPYNENIQTGLHQAFRSTDFLNFSPRVGFTWSPTGSDKTVISGGIGVFYDALAQGIMEPAFTNLPGNLDFQTPRTALWADPGANGAQAALFASRDALRAGFANGGTYNSINAAMPAGIAFAAPSYSNFLGTMHTPQYQEWNLQIQRVIAKDMSVTLNYFGTHGIHVPVSNTWGNAYDGSGMLGLPTAAPDPSYAIITQWSTSAVSNSNGLSATLAKRFSHGFSFQANYTWSHSLDEVSNGGGFVYGNDSLMQQLSPLGLRNNNYGNSDYDIRHNFNANFVYEPTWKFANKGLNGVLAGWAFSGTIFARTGLPFTVMDDNSDISNANIYGLLVGILPALPTGAGAQGPCSTPADQCINGGAFGDAYSGAIPTQARNQFRGPGFFDVNFNLMKSFKLTERMKFGVGANVYNLFNHPNFANPTWFSSDPTLGQIQSTVSTPASPYGSFVGAAASPRLVQLQAKITF